MNVSSRESYAPDPVSHRILYALMVWALCVSPVWLMITMVLSSDPALRQTTIEIVGGQMVFRDHVPASKIFVNGVFAGGVVILMTLLAATGAFVYRAVSKSKKKGPNPFRTELDASLLGKEQWQAGLSGDEVPGASATPSTSEPEDTAELSTPEPVVVSQEPPPIPEVQADGEEEASEADSSADDEIEHLFR